MRNRQAEVVRIQFRNIELYPIQRIGITICF